MNAWARWRSLTSVERATFSRAARRLAAISFRLRRGAYRDLQARLDGVGPGLTPKPRLPPERLAGIVDRVADRAPWNSTCLERSLTLAWLLRRQGSDSEIRIGVRRQDGELAFHAWVESAGEVINDVPDVAERFTPFGDSEPPTGATFV